MFTIMSCWKPTDATYFRLGEKACKQHKRSTITSRYNDKVSRKKTQCDFSILIIKERLKRGGVRLSQFQNPAFHTLRRKPCPCHCFTKILFLHASLQCRNFKPSIYHLLPLSPLIMSVFLSPWSFVRILHSQTDLTSSVLSVAQAKNNSVLLVLILHTTQATPNLCPFVISAIWGCNWSSMSQIRTDGMWPLWKQHNEKVTMDTESYLGADHLTSDCG